MSSALHTTILRDLHVLVQQGDQAATNELLRRAALRLEFMARCMLRHYPRVRQANDTGDVVQEATLSLLSALRQLTFASTREFYGLASEHMRRRLLDMVRRYSRVGAAPLPTDDMEREAAPGPDEDLERWEALHQAVATLPADQREVFVLRFYHDWSVGDVAAQLGVSERTVHRLWTAGKTTLQEKLGGGSIPGTGAMTP